MFHLGRRYAAEDAGVLRGFTDWHCHILPGVDDGIRTMDEALGVLEWYGGAGVSRVWLTPHIMEDIPNSTEALRERFAQLCEAYRGPVRLHLASENMMDNLFLERLASRDLLPLGEEGKLLLVETSYFNPPVDLYGIFEKIREAGFEPLLAHPERYVYMDMDDYSRLRAEGILLQMNIPSLCGAYGREASDKAHRLLSEGYYDRCGSDLHRLSHFQGAVRQKVLDTKTVKKLNDLL